MISRKTTNAIFAIVICLFTLNVKAQFITVVPGEDKLESVTNCFYDTAENVISRLNSQIANYKTLCKIDGDVNIQKIMAVGDALSRVEAYTNSTVPNDTLKGLSGFSNMTANWTVAGKVSDFLKVVNTNTTTGPYLTASLNALQADWYSIVKTGDYPVSYKSTVWKVVLYSRMVEVLKARYPNLKSCLNPKLRGLTQFNDLAISSSTSDEFNPDSNQCKDQANDFSLDPLYLSEGGVTITFWVAEDLPTIQTTPLQTVMQGYAGNAKLYDLTLKAEGTNTSNYMTVANQTYYLASAATCSDYVFYLINFAKDCDHYRMTVVARFLSSNSRFVFQRNMTAANVEQIKFNFIKPFVQNVKMYKNIKYSPAKEIAMMTYGTDVPTFDSLTKASDVCTNPLPNCLYSTATGCAVCQDNKFYLNNTCVDSCPKSYFVSNKVCTPCNERCDTCSGAELTQCGSCKSPFVLFGTTCQSKCPDNMVPVSRVCTECTPGCAVCKDVGVCATCKADSYLLNGKCVTDCGSAFFKSLNPNVCSACSNSCTQCASADKCTMCSSGMLLFNGGCVASCPAKFFADLTSGSCLPCLANCQKCSNSTSCDSCVSGYLLQTDKKKCLTDCPAGTVPYQGACVNCADPNCLTCDATNINACIKCNDSNFLKLKKCVPTCGDEFYLDNVSKKCLPCTTKSCLTCTADKCMQCALPKLVLEDKTCVYDCPDGYIKSGSTCLKCKSPTVCKRCLATNLDTCSECYNDKLFLAGTCVDNCPDGYFKEDTFCTKCADGCKTCTDKFTCSQCLPNFFRKGNTCVADCGSGYVNINGVCTSCSVINCDKCDATNVVNCLKCKSPRSLYANKCRRVCPAGTLLNSDFTCSDCVKDCEVCGDKVTCDRCFNPKVLQGSTCQATCDDGYFAMNRKCNRCSNATCKKCDTNSDTCTECQSGKLLSNGSCVDSCPAGTYVNGLFCSNCQLPCKTCKDTKTCTACNDPFALVGTVCIDGCADGQVKQGDKCLPCNAPNCAKCNPLSIDKCFRCKDTFFLLNDNCLPVCPAGFFSVNNTCQPCQKGCSKCLDSNTCTVCEDGLFLLGKRCVSTSPICPEGFVLDATTNFCKTCKTSCKTCSVDGTTCLTCPENYLLFQGDCITECPEGTFRSKGVCQTIPINNCAILEDASTCDKCSNQFLLKENECITSPCPVGYSKLDNNCVKCEVKDCSVCPSTNTKVCTECKQGLSLYKDNICDTSCPVTTFKSADTKKCQSCGPFCAFCNDAGTCTKCNTNFFLLSGNCVRNCPTNQGYTQSGDSCVQCTVTGCSDCRGNANSCQSCQGSLLLKDNTCIATCPDGFFEMNGICKPCPLFCKTCDQDGVCKTCQDGMTWSIDKGCTDNCPDGSVSIKGTCTNCKTDNSCMKCSVTDPTICVQCAGSSVLFSNKCVADCPERFFNAEGVCQACGDNCVKCKGSRCEQCQAGFVLQDSKCQQTCNLGYYVSEGKCLACDYNCDNCDSSKCTKCSANLFLENGKCKAKCSKGMFPRSTNECNACSANCINCDNESNCKICTDGLFIKNGQCVSECGSGYTLKGSTCVPCDEGCLSCSSQDTKICIKCDDKYKLSSGSCKGVCPAASYFDGDNRICVNCLPNCDFCSSINTCDKCSTGFALQANKKSCQKSCEDGFVAENGVCVPCSVNNCESCPTDKTKCQKCYLPFFNLENNSCASTCPDGYFANGRDCAKCPAECKTCQDTATCKSCVDTFVLSKNKCVNKCDEGQINLNGTCQSCKVDGCKICDITLNTCLECTSGKYLLEKVVKTTTSNNSSYFIQQSCVTDCGLGMFVSTDKKCTKCVTNCDTCSNAKECIDCSKGFVNQNGKCQERCDVHFVERNRKCNQCTNPQCQICDNLDLTKCSRCDKGYFLKNSDCVKDCGLSYFPFAVDTDASECRQCINNCKTCSDSNICKECNDGFLVQEGKCVSSCSSGYVTADKKICSKCIDTNCQLCDFNNLSNCLVCKDPFVRQDKKCATACNLGFVADSSKNCIACQDANCNVCNPFDTCTSCKPNMVVYAKGCASSCPPGFYTDSNSTCKPCYDSNCANCPGDGSICKQCKTGFFVENNKCVVTCSTGSFANKNALCQSCGPNCDSCADENTCRVCKTGFVLDSDNICKDKCPKGKVNVASKCVTCSTPSCDFCDSKDPKVCIECSSGFALFNNTCVNNCPSATYQLGKKCINCDTNCVSCVDSTNCTQCNTDFFLQDKVCVSDCRSGSVAVEGKCTACGETNCDICDPTNLKTCTKCKAGFFRYKSTCVVACPKATISNSVKMCTVCSDNCIECDTLTTCKTCLSGFYVYKGACLANAPARTTIIVPDRIADCTNPNCKTCDPANLNKCTVCFPERILYNGDCILPTSCPVGTFYSSKDLTCMPCDTKCVSCSSATSCDKCLTNFNLDNGMCLSNCPDGKVPRGNVCYSCADARCRVCNPSNLSSCTDCLKGFLLGEACIDTCPAGYRADTVTKKCIPCPTNCNTCNDSSCTTCNNNFYFAEGTNSCVTCNTPDLIIGTSCSKCKPVNCLKCVDGMPNQCSICASGKVIVNGQCLDNCPVGSYKKGQDCPLCSSNCLSCIDSTTCNKCDATTYLFNNACSVTCPDGWISDANRNCVKCAQDDCLKCRPENLNDCETCKANTFKYQNLCYKLCPDGTFAGSVSECKVCPTTCKTCDSMKCKNCLPGFKLKGNDCVTTCGLGYFDDGVNCTQCTDNNCDVCKPVGVCTSCRKGSFLAKDGTCKLICPDGTYANSDNNTCTDCLSGCAKCTASECAVCAANLFKEKGNCVKTCQSGSTVLVDSCVPCGQSTCSVCTPNDPNKCLTCNNKLFLYNSVCVDKCPMGSYLDTDGISCRDCDKSCIDCTKTECKTCKQEFVMNAGICVSQCPDGKVLYGKTCVPCNDTQCKTCLTDTNICISCKAPSKLVDTACKDKCPDGFFKGQNNDCVNCSEGCALCSDNLSCQRCTKGFFLFNGKCLRTCTAGYFGDCKDGTCKACNESCDECYDATNSDCVKCKADYYKNYDTCVKPTECRLGTYADKDRKECTPCKVGFCKECSEKSTCKTCSRGFQYNTISNVCELSKNFVSAIKSPRLFSRYTSANLPGNEKISFNTDLKGVAVGNFDFTVSFWIRKLKKSSPGTVFFKTTDANYPIQSLQMSSIGLSINSTQINSTTTTTVTNEICEFRITSNKNGKSVAVNTIDCSYTSLYNWKYFLINLSRNSDGTSLLKVRVNDGTSKEFTVTVPADSSDFLSKDTLLEFNKNNLGFDAFEVAQMNVFDYFPSETDLSALASRLPENCDYMCKDCRQTCQACQNGNLLSDGSCPASFIQLSNIVGVLDNDLNYDLRDKLTGRYSSDRYALSFFFYVTNMSQNAHQKLASLYYKTLDSNTPVSPSNSVLRVSILDNKILLNHSVKLDNPEIKNNTWYMMSIGVSATNSVAYLREWNAKEAYKQQFTLETNITRPFDDLTVTLGNVYGRWSNATTLNSSEPAGVHITGNSFSPRFYLNNLPTDKDVNDYFNTITIPVNCQTIRSDFTCGVCSAGFSLKDGVCVDNSLDTGSLIVTKTSLWSKDTFSVDISDKKGDTFSLSIWMRKKRASLQTNEPNVILSTLVGGVKQPLVKQVNGANYNSELRFFFADNSYLSVPHNYANEVSEYIHVVINSQTTTSDIEYNIAIKEGNDTKVYSQKGKWASGIANVGFGDSATTELNFEFALSYVYQKALSAENIAKVRSTPPKDCDPVCTNCDYTTGYCNSCIQTGQTNRVRCGAYLDGFKSLFIWNQDSYKDVIDASIFTTNERSKFDKDVNSLTFSVIGYFRTLDWSNYLSVVNGNFRLATVTSADSLNSDIYPGKNLISLEVVVTNSTAALNWVIDDVDTPKYYPFTPKPDLSKGDWILVYGGLSVREKKFRYRFQMNNDTASELASIDLPSVSSRLTERSAMRVFGFGDKLGPNYAVPNGQFSNFYLNPNFDYQDNIWNAYKTNFPLPISPACAAGCLKCILDANSVNVCLTCDKNHNNVSGECKLATPKKVGYLLLSDITDNFESGVNYDTTKFFTSDVTNFSVSFYFRRNFYPANVLNANTLMTFGTMKVAVMNDSSNFYFNLQVTVDGESSLVKLGPMDKDATSDYKWYSLTLAVNTKDKKIQAYLNYSDKTVFLSGDIKLVNSFVPSNKLTLVTSNNEMQIYAAHLANDLIASPITDAPSADCEHDCAVCVKGTCKECSIGKFDGVCNKNSIKLPNYLFSKDTASMNRYKLSDYFGKSKVFRSKSFSIALTIDITSTPKSGVVRVFRMANSGDDAEMSPFISNFLTLNYLPSSRKFTLDVNGRYSISNSFPLRGEYIYSTAGLNSNTHYVTLAFDGVNNTVTVNIRNGRLPAIEKTDSFKGASEMLSANSYIHFAKWADTDPADYSVLYRDIEMFYSYAESDSTKLANLQFRPAFQGACNDNSRDGCLQSNFKLLNGICVSNDRTISMFSNQIQIASYLYPIAASKFTTLKVNKFTTSIWWRRVNYDTSIFGIFRVVSSTGLDILRVYIEANTLKVEGRVGSPNTVIIPDVYSSTDGFDWMYIAATYDIILNNISLITFNSNTNASNYKFSNVNDKVGNGLTRVSATPVGDDTYSVNIGYLGTDMNQNSPYLFEAGSFVFTPAVVLDNSTIDSLSIRRPIACASPCQGKCNSSDICPVNSRISQSISIKAADETVNMASLKDYPMFKMFSQLKTGLLLARSYNSFLISFDMDVANYLQSTYTFNPKVLLAITNSPDNIVDQRMNELMHESGYLNSVLAVTKSDKGHLKIYAGSNQLTGSSPFTELQTGGGIKDFKKIYIAVLFDGKNRSFKLQIYYDDVLIYRDVSLVNSPQGISSFSFAYTHPALNNVRVNVHNPRFSDDFEKYLYTTSSFVNNTPTSAFCSSDKSCAKCNIYGNPFLCSKCSTGFKIFDNTCLSEGFSK